MAELLNFNRNPDGSFGPIDPNAPDAEEARTRGQHASEAEHEGSNLWIEGVFKAYAVIAVAIGATYCINHLFEWGGMIFNLTLVSIFSLILLPNLASPATLGGTTLADVIGKLIPGVDVKVTKTYFGKVLPQIQFWSFLALGSMGGLPWFMGPVWLIFPAITLTLFAVFRWWKYRDDSTIVQVVTRWYVLFGAVLVLVFMLGLNGPIGNIIEKINPPTRFSEETGRVQTMMDPVTGEEFPTLSPQECENRSLGFCINLETGVRLVPFDQNRVDTIFRARRAATPQVDPTSTGALVFGGNSVATAPVAPTCAGMNCVVKTFQPGEKHQMIGIGDGSGTKQAYFKVKPGGPLLTSEPLIVDGENIGRIFHYQGTLPQTYEIWEEFN